MRAAGAFFQEVSASPQPSAEGSVYGGQSDYPGASRAANELEGRPPGQAPVGRPRAAGGKDALPPSPSYPRRILPASLG
ncbi:hypothetical protein NDU88_001098 [Pleurodeles waltl]|uniref:Uncharacterized protein n=1 Tax=Pleurodeles waltl TaxID=8319 RepID=A0AAV7NCG9_PLEWA|nr:hypothetical protein NDU88_001098 [Pleurodeles waltl]